MLHSIQNKIFKLFVILGISLGSVSADQERINELTFLLEDYTQHLSLTIEDLTYIMDQIFNDEAFVPNESQSLIAALQFALSSTRQMENSELMTQIQHYLRQLGVHENLTPPMTQYSQN